jgi:hypothetical protein
MDGGGEVSSHSSYVQLGARIYAGQSNRISLSGSYQRSAYDLSNGSPGSFSSLDPWGDVHAIQLSLPIQWDLPGEWSFFGVPSVRFAGEDGAGIGDSLSGGLIAGASYRLSDRLTLGPGIGFISQIEDDVSIFPLVYVKWRFTDTLTLTTVPTSAGLFAPGLALNWQISDEWQFTFGARYEKLRFRLDDGGVAEDRTIPVYGSLTYQATDHWRVTFLGGIGLANELLLEDHSGRRLRKSDADPAPFIGLSAAVYF